MKRQVSPLNSTPYKPSPSLFFVQLHIQNGGTLNSIDTILQLCKGMEKREVGFDFLDAHKRSVGQGVASRERCS